MHRLPFVLLAATTLATPAARADFGLRDGDVVAFLGDSITAERTYGKVVENYTLLRYPGRNVRFLNVGRGGDTAAGGLARLEADVIGRGATVVIVAYGINDIGWGTKADPSHRAAYLGGIRGIVEGCRARGIRVYVASAAITAEDPDKAEAGYLQGMVDEGLALARSLGSETIDLQRGMRAIQRRVVAFNAGKADPKERVSLHAADGVHLNDLGGVAMAFAILKGLGAPAEVSGAIVDGGPEPKVLSASGCKVEGAARRGDRLEFDRLDEGLPLGFGVLAALRFWAIPFGDGLNGYTLAIKDLPPGRYAIEADGRPLGTWTADALASGVNLAWATADGWQPGGPWDAQADLLRRVTDARNEVAEVREGYDRILAHDPAIPALRLQADEADARLVALQKGLTRPRPYHFVVKPAPAEAKAP